MMPRLDAANFAAERVMPHFAPISIAGAISVLRHAAEVGRNGTDALERLAREHSA
jgi:hypothetical protein